MFRIVSACAESIAYRPSGFKPPVFWVQLRCRRDHELQVGTRLGSIGEHAQVRWIISGLRRFDGTIFAVEDRHHQSVLEYAKFEHVIAQDTFAAKTAVLIT